MPLSEVAISVYEQKQKIFKMPPTLVLIFMLLASFVPILKPLPQLAQSYTYPPCYTVMPQNLLRNIFFDLRNIFLKSRKYQEIFLKTRNFLQLRKNFLVSSVTKSIFIQENGLKIRTTFLKQEVFSRQEKLS